ncbi:MAG: sensor histidine kinase [Ignavibacteriaceae bacterium]
MTPESLFSLNNPVIYSILLLVIILVIIFTFYSYVIKPMRVHFDKEKNDITRKHLELMAAFSELDPEPVFRFDGTGNIIMTNQAGNDLDTSKYAINKPLVSIIPEVAQIDLDSCINENKALNIISDLNGRTFQFTIRGFSRMQIGQIYGSDITELKLAEEKLKHALIKAEESEKLKTNFLSQMSHEIRSPLTAVLGFNRIVKEQFNNRSSEDLTFAFEAIEKSGKRLIRTMDQLLNMSQLQTVTYDISRQEVELLSFIKKLINEFNNEIELKKLNIILENELVESKIICDTYALNQIVQNILDNAIKYTSKGEIKIHLGKDSKERIILSVSDTGIGMSEDYIKELYKPFSQEVMGYNRPFEGNGLGLAISKRYAELNNINIRVDSIKNSGTTVTLIFN